MNCFPGLAVCPLGAGSGKQVTTCLHPKEVGIILRLLKSSGGRLSPPAAAF